MLPDYDFRICGITLAFRHSLLNGYKGTDVDILAIIKSEHREVSGLFDQAQKCEPGDEHVRELASQIEQKLSLHLAIEERLFYSTLRDQAEDDEEKVDVFEAYTEHEVAKHLMTLLKSGRRNDDRFKAELQVLGESVKHHVEEEESKVFKIARELLDQDELDDLGEKWQAAKKRALSKNASNGKTSPKRKATARSRR